MLSQGRYASWDNIMNTGPVVYVQGSGARSQALSPQQACLLPRRAGRNSISASTWQCQCFLGVPRTLLTGVEGPEEKGSPERAGTSSQEGFLVEAAFEKRKADNSITP